MQPYLRHSDTFTPEDLDGFRPRDRIPTVLRLLFLFVACFFVIYTAAFFIGTSAGPFTLALVLFLVIGPLCWHTVYFTQHTRDIMLATEFQNALFSSALHLRARFVMILRQDGSVLYHDHYFREFFPETQNRGILFLDKLFNSRYLTPLDVEKLHGALEANKTETIYMNLLVDNDNPSAGSEKFVITVEPLPRHKSYFILRGRNFVEKNPITFPAEAPGV